MDACHQLVAPALHHRPSPPPIALSGGRSPIDDATERPLPSRSGEGEEGPAATALRACAELPPQQRPAFVSPTAQAEERPVSSISSHPSRRCRSFWFHGRPPRRRGDMAWTSSSAVGLEAKLLVRRLRVYYCALRVYLRVKATQYRGRRLQVDAAGDGPDAARSAALWSATHTANARRMLALALSLEALWIKAGQYISSRGDVLPPEFINELAVLQDALPPVPTEVVRSRVVRELGGRTIRDVFCVFDDTALATASVAQVHRATLADDSRLECVVKVRHPGVKTLIMQDLDNLTRILAAVAGAEPEFDYRAVMAEWVKQVPLEMDFAHELENMERIRACFAAAPPELATRAVVPRPLRHLTTSRMLVMEFSPGIKPDFETLRAAGVDRAAIITEVTKAFGLQLLILGVFTGDPHPGNLLIERDPERGDWRPVLLDFGLSVELAPATRLGFARLVLAAADNDSYSLLAAFRDMSIKLGREDPAESLETVRFLFRATAPREDNVQANKDFSKRMEERIKAREKELEQGESRVESPSSGSRLLDRFRAWRRGDSATAAAETSTGTTTSATSGSVGDKAKAAVRRNPVDSFPGELVFMLRSLGLLRGLCTQLRVRSAYLPVMRTYAARALMDSVPQGERLTATVHPSAAAVADGVKRRRLAKRLHEALTKVLSALYERDVFLGMQVAVYFEGELLVDLAAGRKGEYDARPVTSDTLFNAFSVTKGVTAAAFARVADRYGVQPEDPVARWWPAFGAAGKAGITVGHLLSHTAGLADAVPPGCTLDRLRDDWGGLVEDVAAATPAHAPGVRSVYHYLSWGWLMGGLIEAITGRRVTAEFASMARVLGVDGELYCGNMPAALCADVPGSRVAKLSNALFKGFAMAAASAAAGESGVGSSNGTGAEDAAGGANVDRLYGDDGGDSAIGAGGGNDAAQDDKDGDWAGESSSNATFVADAVARAGGGTAVEKELRARLLASTPSYMLDVGFFNHPSLRAACLPSANGHFTARALARLYAALANDGAVGDARLVAPGRVAQMMAPLWVDPPADGTTTVAAEDGSPPGVAGVGAAGDRRGADAGDGGDGVGRVAAQFSDGAAWGAGVRLYDTVSRRGVVTPRAGLGHSGIGGSIAFAVPARRLAVAVTVNRLEAVNVATAAAILTVCKVLDVPPPATYAAMRSKVIAAARNGKLGVGKSGVADVLQMMTG